MTAEIAVMNRVGVALAADSAVSIGRRADKIWTSAEKLFQLSECDPVGVMIYGNADFVGLPWETVIKSYRREHGNAHQGRVEDHAASLIDYLESGAEMFPAERQDAHVVQLCNSLLIFFRTEIEGELNSTAEKQDGIDENELPEILDGITKRLHDLVTEYDLVEDLPKNTKQRLRSRYAEAIAGSAQRIFGSVPLRTASMARLQDACLEMLTRQMFGPAETGVVVAGFGESQFLPALYSFSAEELVLGKVRLKVDEVTVIGDESDAAVIPFAQKEMVATFMQGIDPQLGTYMQESARHVLLGAVEQVLGALGSAVTHDEGESLRAEVSTLVSELLGRWSGEQKKYWAPVVTNIASLPKDELAAMAESFVNLTKFKRRVSTERETVGGPIDVAVITRGDGFVWVKRKHYFDAQRNPRVMARYLRGMQ